jgi:hypothetical protein
MFVVLSPVVGNQNIVIIGRNQNKETVTNSYCHFSSWDIDLGIQDFWNTMLYLVVNM